MRLLILLFICFFTYIPAASAQETRNIIVFGDSMLAGIADKDNFPSQLQRALDNEGIQATVLNGGVSGDTSAMTRNRLQLMLNAQPSIVILVSGINDILRGIPPQQTRNNLAMILQTLQQRQVEVVIVGMQAPRTAGVMQQADFNGIYADLAKQYSYILYPSYLKKVNPALMQKDGIHPMPQGIAMIVQDFMPYLKKVIR